MENKNLDLGMFSSVFSAYTHRIKESLTSEEALLHAAAFLSKVEWMFDKDIKSAFYDEVEYLWATFPSRVKFLDKYKTLLKVLLEQAVDFYWYVDYPQYQTAKDAKGDATLYSFGRFSEEFEVKFMYVQYYGHILMRVPNLVRLRYRRLINHPGKYTQGLLITRCNKAIVGLINQLSEDVTREIGSKRPFKVLVNSVLRTVKYQNALAEIGYVAPRHSAHLAGYAVDVEKLWYEKHDQHAHRAIKKMTCDLFERGVINLIDEGTHWHLCLNPDHIPYYEALTQKWHRNNR